MSSRVDSWVSIISASSIAAPACLGRRDRADPTAPSWMAMYCLNMLTIALELAEMNPVYEDMATKFFEHFLYIADAMNHIGATARASGMKKTVSITMF